MNNILKVVLPFSLLSVYLPTSAIAVTLGFSPSNQTTNLGSQVTVDLIVSDLGDNIAPSLGEFDLVVGFDGDIIAFESLEFGTQLNSVTSAFSFRGETLLSADEINLFEISGEFSSDLITLQPSSFTLATFSFDAVGLGTSDLTLSNAIVGDSAGLSLIPNLETGAITVIADEPKTVPESSTGIALLSFGFMFWTWRYSKKFKKPK